MHTWKVSFRCKLVVPVQSRADTWQLAWSSYESVRKYKQILINWILLCFSESNKCNQEVLPILSWDCKGMFNKMGKEAAKGNITWVCKGCNSLHSRKPQEIQWDLLLNKNVLTEYRKQVNAKIIQMKASKAVVFNLFKCGDDNPSLQHGAHYYL